MITFSKSISIFCVVFLISIHIDVALAEGGKPVEDADYSSEPSLVIGEEIFYRQWQNGSFNEKHAGLGPLYNAYSCVACHINNGRGRPPLNNVFDPSFVLRLSIPPQNEKERMALALEKYASVAEPRYGRQLQDKGIGGSQNGEGEIRVEYRDKPFKLDDGEVVILHRPIYSIAYLKFGKSHKNLQVSARVAQPLDGIGLLGNISNEDILAGEDPTDKDGNGISGRVNMVRDVVTGKIMPGRFGWKATQPNLLQQIAAAFAQDIGISSGLFPQTAQGCQGTQVACTITGPSKKPGLKLFDISNSELKLVTEYVSQFRANQSGSQMKISDERVGEKLFARIGCISCHRKSYQVKIKDYEGKARTETIYPYSDLLLHDMGAGLADHRPVAQASGWEWRTQPLWGIGKAEEINGNQFFLHDGRARTIIEAILWHGGEARAARSKFAALNKLQRAALIEFVEGL